MRGKSILVVAAGVALVCAAEPTIYHARPSLPEPFISSYGNKWGPGRCGTNRRRKGEKRKGYGKKWRAKNRMVKKSRSKNRKHG